MQDDVMQRIRQRYREDAAFRELIVIDPEAALRDFEMSDEERQQFILPNFSWLIDNRLAGLARPGSDAAFAALKAKGVKAIVSLTEQPLPQELIEKHGFTVAHLPIPDLTAPSVNQVEQTIAVIESFMAQGSPVAVHCAAGQGRTGTILACYLVAQGYNPHAAIYEVRAKRPRSIEVPEQEAVIVAYADRLAEKKRDNNVN